MAPHERLQPPEVGQIRNWPSRERLCQLFGSHFAIEKILTCAPGVTGVAKIREQPVQHRSGNCVFGSHAGYRCRNPGDSGEACFMVPPALEMRKRDTEVANFRQLQKGSD